MKKLKVIQLILVVALIGFVIVLTMPKEYHKEYEVTGVTINESFDKENKTYYFTFNYNGYTLDYLIEHKYISHRTLIDDIKIITDEDNFCLIPLSERIDTYPICVRDKKIIHYTEVNDALYEQLPQEYKINKESKNDTYKDIEIYNKEYTYLLWSYQGFSYINGDTKKEITLFDKEKYNVSLIGYTTDYLVIANYDSEGYTFNKLYTIAFATGEVKSYKLDRDIYFDSYFIGYEKNNIYLVDNKNSLMYEFNAKKGELEKIKSKILNNGHWEDASIKTLINKNASFTYKTNYEYTLEDNTLYLNYTDKDIKTKVASDIKNIIRVKDKEIFYLKEDTLYVFTPSKGEVKLLTNFEWNFNSEKVIYIN